MDTTALLGVGVVVSAIIVFCGSVFLLLAIVLGSRLAYFVTASVTLAFVLIMAVVWSINPLGPVGEMPKFDPEAIGEGTDVEFGPASSYPDEPWNVPPEDDVAKQEQKSTLENDAADYLEAAIQEGKVDTFTTAGDAGVVPDSSRFIEQDGQTFGAVLFQPTDQAAQAEEVDPSADDSVLIVMQYDPGAPLLMAQIISVVTLVALVLHLVFLSRFERRAEKERTGGQAEPQAV